MSGSTQTRSTAATSGPSWASGSSSSSSSGGSSNSGGASDGPKLPAPIFPNVGDAADRFRCPVCLSDPTDPHLCPKCAQMFCLGCLRRSYEGARSCPHCRGFLALESYVRLPWAEDHVTALKTLAPRLADECGRHPNKVLSVYCNDCSKTACASCWTSDHLGHVVVPIEAANEAKRLQIEFELLPGLSEARKKFDSFRRLTILSHKRKERNLKREGDLRVDELARSLRETWRRECEAMSLPAERVEGGLRAVRAAARSLRLAAEETNLNRLVDDYEALRAEVNATAGDRSSADAAIRSYESIRNRDALHVLAPWLPGWDVKERVTIKECKRILSFNTSSKCVARFTVNDISWKVWVADRGRKNPGGGGGGCDPDSDDGEEEHPWPLNLMIYVTMDGRDRLKNYELCIERVVEEDEESPDDDDVGVGDDSGDDDDDDDDDDEVIRCEIVRRDTFVEGERLFFPIQHPGDWVNGKEELVFVFKVRPLTYQQKFVDQEIYYKRLLAEERARKSSSSATANDADLDEELGQIVAHVSKTRDFKAFQVPQNEISESAAVVVVGGGGAAAGSSAGAPAVALPSSSSSSSSSRSMAKGKRKLKLAGDADGTEGKKGR